MRSPIEPRYKRYAAAQGDGVVGFATPSRRVEIFSGALLQVGQAPLPEYVEPAASPVSRPDLAARFPLVLTTAKVVQFCHSQHRSLPRLRRHSPDPQVELHPDAAQARGIAADDWVVIETPRATMRARARLMRAWRPTWCARSSAGGRRASRWGSGVRGGGRRAARNYNKLIDTDVTDPISGTVAAAVRALRGPPTRRHSGLTPGPDRGQPPATDCCHQFATLTRAWANRRLPAWSIRCERASGRGPSTIG